LPDYKITPKGFQVPEELEKLAETLQGNMSESLMLI
jgi:hypothetical protein